MDVMPIGEMTNETVGSWTYLSWDDGTIVNMDVIVVWITWCVHIEASGSGGLGHRANQGESGRNWSNQGE